MESSSPEDKENNSNVTPPPTSTDNTCDFVGGIQFQRWVVAATIAVCIISFVTGMAFLFQSIWRWRQDAAAVKPLLRPGSDLLGAVACNSTLCHRYKELLSSCTDGAGKSPCAGLSDFVCGEGVCYGRPVESLLRGLLQSLAAEALAAWRLRGDTQWPAVDRAAALYDVCHERSRRNVMLGSIGDSVSIDELNSFLATNDSAADLAMRLAGRYQDGGFFWLDIAPRRSESKLRLQLKANKQFLQNAHDQEQLSSRRNLRSPQRTFVESLSRSDVGQRILRAMNYVHMLWKKAGNLRAYAPVLIPIEELDKYELNSSILIEELNQGGSAVFDKADRIEVANGAILPFLRELLQTSNIKAYLVWEFVRHGRACTVPIDLEGNTLANACFDCVERVAGLAAHAPFLFTSHDAESQAKASSFLQQVKQFVVSSVVEAKWLPARQQEHIIERLFRLQFVRGIPARKGGMAQLNDYYAYLPNGTGNFVDDYRAASIAAWKWSLTRTEESLVLLSAFPNVLTKNNTVFVPAVALVPPLFNYGDVESAQFSLFSVALIRATLHSLGLTGLHSTPYPHVETVPHLNILGRCLTLNSSTREYSSRMADVMAVGTALRLFGIGQEENVVLNSCLFMCTAEDPRRCDMPAGQAVEFENAFACPRTSPMSRFKTCFVW
ncbi:hypothetical protein V5799_018916 [Amblyomma americanum]|uniref:Uncharacterized protein n=1 Tax=Amblyomma americanum TaxID=6943 RepID=A0AAQ4EXW2_AMBAM